MVSNLFDDQEDLKVFAEAQTKTIINLNKKINELNDEIKHLKSVLSKSTPIISTNLIEESDDEETIARMQLRLLKNVSLERELTYEETKKVDIYAKLLLTLMGRNKNKVSPGKDLSTEDLLKLVESE